MLRFIDLAQHKLVINWFHFNILIRRMIFEVSLDIAIVNHRIVVILSYLIRQSDLIDVSVENSY